MARKDDNRGEGRGNEEGLTKATGSEGMEELQKAADERNERGFVSFDDEQAELLLEEDRAGSLPDPREPKHEAERKAKLAAEDEAVAKRAAEQSLEVDDDGVSK